MNRKLAALLVTASALAVAVPTIAQADKGGHPHKGSHGQSATTTTTTPATTTMTTPATTTATTPTATTPSHKCHTHNVGFVESGTVDATTASTLAATNGTWSGTVVADITKANHWAAGDKGKTVTHTFTNATLSVRLPRNTTGLTAGERVKLIGKLAVVVKKCPAPSTAATPVFSKVIVHPAAA